MILCFYAYYCWYFLHKVPKVSFKQAQNTCLHRDVFSLKKNYSREGICLLSLCASYFLPTVFSLLSLIEYRFWFPRQRVYCRYGQLSLLSLASLRLEIIFRLRIPISILNCFQITRITTRHDHIYNYPVDDSISLPLIIFARCTCLFSKN